MLDHIISLIILTFSAIVHEVTHGLVAEKLGDPTAREQGRITLNPISHIDPFSTILLPLMLIIAGSPIVFGSAKPVPVDYGFFKNPKLGMSLVALAGPVSNFVLAVICILPIKLGLVNPVSGPILFQAALLNIVLGVFNLMPIPPLDGSKLLAGILPHKYAEAILSWEQYGFILVFLFLISGALNFFLVPVIALFLNIFNLPFSL